MKVRNGWIVAEISLYVFLPATFGWFFRKATLRPLLGEVEAQA